MPFIITTKRPQSQIEPQITWHVSRLAVATLEEARTEVTRLALVDGEALLAENYADLRQQFAAVREAGGTVGPFPDGTTVEVKPVNWLGIERLTLGDDRYPGSLWPTNVANDPRVKGGGFTAEQVAQARAEILAAFNARGAS